MDSNWQVESKDLQRRRKRRKDIEKIGTECAVNIGQGGLIKKRKMRTPSLYCLIMQFENNCFLHSYYIDVHYETIETIYNFDIHAIN
jgi:hypothetical protein